MSVGSFANVTSALNPTEEVNECVICTEKFAEDDNVIEL